MCQDWQEIQLADSSSPTLGLANGVLWDDTSIVVGGPGLIFKTTDFFNSYTADSNYFSVGFDDIVFLGRDTGYITSYEVRGGMLRTFDGGNTWNPMPTGPQQGGPGGSELVFANADTAYSDGGSGLDAMIHTYNCGVSWSQTNVPLSICKSFFRIKLLHDSIIYVLCSAAADAGYSGWLYLIKSTDYGTDWQEIYRFQQFGTGDLCILDDTTFLVLCNDYIYKSTNAGYTFDSVLNTNIELRRPCGYSFSFPSHDTGFVEDYFAVYKTYDAGSTWTRTNFQINSHDYSDHMISFICASSADKVIVGTEGGYLYRTTNGGGVYTGITNFKTAPTFTISPNPTTGPITVTPAVNATGNYTVDITNLLGQTVYKTYPTNNQIDVSNLAPGIYLLKLTTASGYQTAKFVKQ